MIGNWEWEDDKTTIGVDMEGIKGGGIVLCWVDVVVVGIANEMGTMLIGGITGGEVLIGGITVEEEAKELGRWWITTLCIALSSSLTKTSILITILQHLHQSLD